MAVRCHMHLIAGRAMDQLTFDIQVEVAERMGYRDRGGRRAVEFFMQDYFRQATRVGELTRIVLTDLEARHTKKAPDLFRMLRRKKAVKDGYRLVHNRLSIADERLPRRPPEPPAHLRGGAADRLPPPPRRDAASRREPRPDRRRRPRRPGGRRIFFDTLLKHANPERALRRMNELGVLAAFIPEFAPIVAMMQFNMYHHYTVDEHTIQCISILAQIERGELVEELPIASRILKGEVNRKVLYVALLLHDIGKGREEDHSVAAPRSRARSRRASA
jgi:[protein-PII] uridylyltransferase